MMTAQIASTSSINSNQSNADDGGGGSSVGNSTYDEGTYEGTTSLTSSIQMRGDNSTLDDEGNNSMISGSSRELSLPSSFASTARSGGGTISLSTASYSQQSHLHTNNAESMHPSKHSLQSRNDAGRMEVYNESQLVNTTEVGEDGASESSSVGSSSLNSEDRLTLRITKETKAHEHLLRLLQEMDAGSPGGDNNGDPRNRAVASLISDFQQEVSLIEHNIKNEGLIMNGEQTHPQQLLESESTLQLPLPPNWIALEDPDSGDVYYANEATGVTQWERPGMPNDLNNSQLSNNFQGNQISNNFQGSQLSNNFQGSQLSNNFEGSQLGTNFQGSQLSNNFSQRSNLSNNSNHNSNTKLNNSHQSNISNNSNSMQRQQHEQQDMRNSNASNNYNNRMNSSNQSNNFEGAASGVQGSNLEGSGNLRTSNMSNNYQSDMSNTYESSLTDSQRSNLTRDLPKDWIALEDPDSGETYYANEVTGESTWEKPTIPQLLPQENTQSVNGGSVITQSVNGGSVIEHDDDQLPEGWIALEDADSGDTYYLNEVTMATTWDRPTREGDEGSQPPPADVGGSDDNSQQPSENTCGPEEVVGDSELPPGWEAILDEDSGDYYYSHENGQTQWERPINESNNSVGPDETANSQQGSAVGNVDNGEVPQDGDLPLLPPGWFAAVDEDSGDQYYCNEVTDETTWELPTEPASPGGNIDANHPNQEEGVNDDDLPSGWFEATDPSSGDVYYCHEESGETTWDRPTGGASNMTGGNEDSNANLMSRLSLQDNTVYEDDSVTSSQY